MRRLIPLIVAAILFAVDQVIKNWAFDMLLPQGQIIVIPGLFYLTYVENRGAAFGILQGQTVLLSVISGILLFAIVLALLLGKIKSRLLVWCVSIGIAGGFGNLYDRVIRGFVVDYFDFSALFGFPVFNFADCLVVGATFVILVYCLKQESSQKGAVEEPGNG